MSLLHQEIGKVYNCSCDACRDKPRQSEVKKLAGTPGQKELLKKLQKAFKLLHDNGGYKPTDLEQYKEVVDELASVFKQALDKGITVELPEEMMTSLKRDVYLFSGMKTHAQLYEASRLLLDDDGQVKSFSRFLKDVKSLNKKYNEDYLEAEYIFAVTTSQQIANWAIIEAGGDRYDLQYRTAGDDRVRPQHLSLDQVTLPPSDKFWDEYYPPNGWRCRCRAIQVNKGKYELTERDLADKLGKASMSEKEQEIFRFNAYKQAVIFPPNHPYSKVIGSADATTTL